MAERFAEFMQNAYANPLNGTPEQSDFYAGFIIAGYSTGAPTSEEYALIINGQQGGQIDDPAKISYEGKAGHDVGYGVYTNGQPEAASRLIRGYGSNIEASFRPNSGLPPDVEQSMSQVRSQMFSELASPFMPIQDAVDLAEFLLDLTIKYIRFVEGDQTVGGPIELAAITKHEGFKWVRRKYYFPAELNQY